MKKFLLSSALVLGTAFAANADIVTYELDASHSQIVFDYEHLGYSTTFGVFSGFTGTIDFDADAPETSSVKVAFPADSLYTGWDGRTAHFLGGDFFDTANHPEVSFVSTGIEITGEDTGKITGDLTIKGVTKSVVLDANLNQSGAHPRSKKTWIGFDATTSVLRSEFNMGMAAPYVSDEVQITISIEAGVEK